MNRILSQFHALSFLTPCFLKTIFLIKSRKESVGSTPLISSPPVGAILSQFHPSYSVERTSETSILMSASYLFLGLPSGWFPRHFPTKKIVYISLLPNLSEKHRSNICVLNCRTGFQCCLFFGHKKRERHPVLLLRHKCVPIFTKNQRKWASGMSLCSLQ